jgi:hypothetical protein
MVTTTAAAATAAAGLALKHDGSRWDGATMAIMPLRASVLSTLPHALLAKFLCGRRGMTRKMSSCGNDDNSDGAN